MHSLRRALLSDPHTSGAAAAATRVEWWAHARPAPSHPGHQLHFDVDETRLRKVRVQEAAGVAQGVRVFGGGEERHWGYASHERGGKVTRQGREADDSSWHIAPESPHGALAALNQVLGGFLTTQHVLILPSINSVNAVVPPNLLGYQLLT